MTLDIRASAASGALMLAWLPVNSCLALLCGPPDQPLTERQILRLYRTKDEAYADWRRITAPRLPGEPLTALPANRCATGAQLPTLRSR